MTFLKLLGGAVGTVLLLSGSPAWTQAAPTAEVADHWRVLTRMDLDAAYALIADNHPGAAAELKDDAFKARLREGRDKAVALASRVDSYDGYVATLGSFAAGMGDKHIW